MKRLMWVICALLLAAGMNAQTKVMEKSAKKVPGWMNTAVDDYLIVSVTVGSLARTVESVTGNYGTYYSGCGK